LSANFRTFFVSGISFRPTDLFLLSEFLKNFTFEDFQDFQEIGAYCDLDLMIIVNVKRLGSSLTAVYM
jgi:hypothetical protein